jgi:hypothetical protein
VTAESHAEKDRLIVVHVSDLHIGDVILTQQFSLVEGWRAHDSLLCFGLETALDDVLAFFDVSEQESPQVVMTGDLTRYGLVNEYCVGHTFLSSFFRLKHAQKCGLRVAEANCSGVVGNHDHWNGRPKGRKLFRPPGVNPVAEETHFPQSQWPKSIASSRGGFQLSLVGIDSSGGFKPGRRSAIARGKVSEKTIDAMKAKFSSVKPRGPSVNCLLCHHSLCYSDELSKLYFFDSIRPVAFERKSKLRLMQAIADVPIHVVLTGHTHTFESRGIDEPDAPPFELRCSTTLQGPATEAHQGFWVHEVFLENQKIRWDSYRYQWDGGRFNRTLTPWHTFQL